MKKSDFPYPNLDIPKELQNDQLLVSTLDSTKNYIDLIQKFIYTDINLDYVPSNILHSRAWILTIISANLLRSLYLRNIFVDAFNSRNTVALYFPLKAWFEIVGLLASILNMLEQKLEVHDLFKSLEPYALGNRGKGGMRIGRVDATNVCSMIEKADKYLQKIENNLSGGDVSKRKFYTDFYDNASNPTHPSYDANELVGEIFPDLGRWRAREPKDISNLIISMRGHYGGLLIAAPSINNICTKIYKLEEDNFVKIPKRTYFS